MGIVTVPGVAVLSTCLNFNERSCGISALAPVSSPSSSSAKSSSSVIPFPSSAFISNSLSESVVRRKQFRIGGSVQQGVINGMLGGEANDNDRMVSGRGFGSSFERGVGKNRGREVPMFVDNGGTTPQGNQGGDAVQSSLEQSRRLLTMQKELLKQIDAALGSNSAKSSDQMKNDSNEAVQSQQEPTPAHKTQQAESLKSDATVENVNNTSKPPGSQETTKQASRRPLSTLWPSAKSPERTNTKSLNQGRMSSQPASWNPSAVVTATPFPRAKPNPFIPPSSPSTGNGHGVPEFIGKGETTEDSSPLAGPNVMNVVVVAAECAPWSKTGGLGDVIGALPKALARRGHRVMVVAPRYSNYLEAWDTSIRKVYNVGGLDMTIGYFHGYKDKVDFVFIDSPLFHTLAGDIYGGSREEVLTRMILLCKAAIEAPWHVSCGGVPYGDGNLVFIANDWHSALLPVYLRAYYQEKGMMLFARCILVIHNMAHQGRGPMSDFGKFGLPGHYVDKFRIFDPIGGEHCNVFKAGFETCHRIVTVSHGYANEVQTKEGGWGLDGIIRDNQWKLRGVVNGIDDEEWNPEIDPCLKDDGYANYKQGDLAGKQACKAALQRELGLPGRQHVPLIGFIGRLDFQKGVDILADAMPWMMSQDLQIVMLGTGRKDLEDMLRTMECQYKDKVRGWVGFSVKTSHRITAGADILLMPSRFEPCGLNQLYAMKYGTIPVVHKVGGLQDTVQQFDPFSESGTGWTFDRPDASGLIHALGNAMWTYHDFKPSWLALQKRGMAQDLSWDHAAMMYEEVLVAAKHQW